MAAKTPTNPTGLFDPGRHIPSRGTTAGSGVSTGFALVENTQYVGVVFENIDSTDTWTSPYGTSGSPDCGLRVVSFCFMEDDTTGQIRVALNPATGVFTFTTAANDVSGLLALQVA